MKNLLVAFLLAFPCFLFAQFKTIQVSVSDSIEVEANHISVMVSFRDTVSDGYSEPHTDFTDEQAAVINLLDQNNIKWQRTADQLGLFGAIGKLNQMGGGDLGITVDFTSVAQMDRVLPRINAIAYVSSVESASTVDKDKVDLTRLYGKLLKKSREKAEKIAVLAGKKVGDVYQIGSAFDGFNPEKYMESLTGGGSPYSGLMKMMGGMFGEKHEGHKVPVTENMTVTYYLLD